MTDLSMHENLAPVVLFVYNRPFHASQTLLALSQNTLAEKTDLYIFCDGIKLESDAHAIEETRRVVKAQKGFRSIEIIAHDKNQGLANSIISGVSSVVADRKKIIVLEDDHITSPLFLEYMNKALHYFQDWDKVFSITGYNFPKKLLSIPENYPYDVYFSPRPSSWGWATWDDKWRCFLPEIPGIESLLGSSDFKKAFNKTGVEKYKLLKSWHEGNIDSWAIRWDYTHFANEAYACYPCISLLKNIGFDGSGLHGKRSANFRTKEELTHTLPQKFPETMELNSKLLKRFGRVNKKGLSFYFNAIYEKLFK